MSYVAYGRKVIQTLMPKSQPCQFEPALAIKNSVGSKLLDRKLTKLRSFRGSSVVWHDRWNEEEIALYELVGLFTLPAKT